MPAVSDACASTVSPAIAPLSSLPDAPPPPTDEPVPVRHLLFGPLRAVQITIRTLYQQGYAEPNDWSAPMPTGRPNEVMVILTRRVRLERQA